MAASGDESPSSTTAVQCASATDCGRVFPAFVVRLSDSLTFSRNDVNKLN